MGNITTSDAELVLKLYDLRREEVMRKARNFVVSDFWPKSAADVLDVANAWGTEQNAYFRQVISFWEMSASLPLRGAVNSELFADWAGEMFFIYAKMSPILQETREAMENPGFMANIEKFISSSEAYLDRLGRMAPRVAKMGQSRRAAAK
jgi:hypothetical protein